jgi:hypothetical protein
MPSVVGIDQSSNGIDLVKLDENMQRAEWSRIPLVGKTAFDRLRTVAICAPDAAYWDDVYLAGVEMPESRFRVSLRAQLPIVGALVALIPQRIEVWSVSPAEWKKPLGLASKEKPTVDSFPGFALGWGDLTVDVWPQDAYDALGVALYARDLNAQGIAARLGAA